MKREYFFEVLSKENIKTILNYVNDQNFDIMLPKIKQIYKENELIGDNFKQYFKNKGLDNKSFDNNPELGFRISSIFSKNDQNEILKNIIRDNGVISFQDLIKNSNIFDICKDFKESAKAIANITNVTSHNVNVGKFEILLKFILKNNAISHNHGDIAIDYEGGYGIEIKGGNKPSTSARIGGINTLSTKEISSYFLNLFNIKNEDVSFMGGASANTRLSKILNDSGINDLNKIIENFVKSFAYQYQIKENDKCVDIMIDTLKKYNKSNNIFTIKNNKVEISRLTNISGVLQLYFYNKKDKWDSIFIANQINGDYVILNSEDLLDFNTIIDNVIFNDFEGNETSTGRRCISRVFPKSK